MSWLNPFWRTNNFFGEQMLLRIQVQGAFQPSGWRRLPSCLQWMRSEQHVRAGSNTFEMCQTCSTCGEQLCSTSLLQKVLDRRCVGSKAMQNTYAVAHAGFQEVGQPSLTLSEVLVTHHTCYTAPSHYTLAILDKSGSAHSLDKISERKKRSGQEQL